MAISPEVKRTARKISLKLLLDQLDQEWDQLQASDQVQPFPERNEIDLLAYYHSAVRVALHWIDGDPYTYKFPREYQTHRLARLCGYLQKIARLQGMELETERDRQTHLLRTQTWPAYSEICTGMNHDGSGGCQAELTYTWSGIDSLWSEQNPEGPQDAPSPHLPLFHSEESEAFHCNVLAVLYLNRATRRPLCDLDITPF